MTETKKKQGESRLSVLDLVGQTFPLVEIKEWYEHKHHQQLQLIHVLFDALK